jgi:hypothetical protein
MQLKLKLSKMVVHARKPWTKKQTDKETSSRPTARLPWRSSFAMLWLLRWIEIIVIERASYGSQGCRMRCQVDKRTNEASGPPTVVGWLSSICHWTYLDNRRWHVVYDYETNEMAVLNARD